jgi:hypothetical protein
MTKSLVMVEFGHRTIVNGLASVAEPFHGQAEETEARGLFEGRGLDFRIAVVAGAVCIAATLAFWLFIGIYGPAGGGRSFALLVPIPFALFFLQFYAFIVAPETKLRHFLLLAYLVTIWACAMAFGLDVYADTSVPVSVTIPVELKSRCPFRVAKHTEMAPCAIGWLPEKVTLPPFIGRRVQCRLSSTDWRKAASGRSTVTSVFRHGFLGVTWRQSNCEMNF